MMRTDIITTSSGSARHKKPVYRIERCRIYFVRWMVNGAAFTLPGIGIFVGKSMLYPGQKFPVAYFNYLILHEYGHILQAKDKGLFLYYGVIAPISLASASWSIITRIAARCSRKINPGISLQAYPHHHTWTEWDASQRAKKHFKENNWPEKWFPTQRPVKKP